MIGSTAHDAPSDTDPSPPPPTARVAAPAAPVDEDDSEIETLRHRILEFEGQIAAEPMAEQRAVEQVPIPSNDTSFATPSDGPTKVEPPPGLSAVATELPMPPSDPAIVTADDYESNDGVLHISYARHEHQVEGAAPVDSPGDPSSSHHRVRHRSSIPVKRKKKKEKKRRSASIPSSVHRVVRVKATDKKLGSWPTTVQFAAWRRALRLAVAGSCDEPDMAKKWIFEVENRDADIAHFKSSRKDTLRARRQVG